MARTTVKSIRLGDEEVSQVASAWRKMFPEASTESDVIRLIFLRGLQLTQAEIAGLTGEAPNGIDEKELALLLVQRVLHVMPLLKRAGYAQTLDIGSKEGGAQTTEGETYIIEASAANSVEELGGEIL